MFIQGRHVNASADWGRVTHICVSKITIIGSNNGLPPGRRQAIIWTNAGILLSGPLGTKFSGILVEMHIFWFTKMHLKMSSGKWRPFYVGLNVSKASSHARSIHFWENHWCMTKTNVVYDLMMYKKVKISRNRIVLYITNPDKYSRLITKST